MPEEDLRAEVERLRADHEELKRLFEEEVLKPKERLKTETEALKQSGRGALSLRISEKGALSVYGLGRFPVTLYKEQWLRLLNITDEIRTFIQQNEGSLKAKE